jgi:hypothetical protein
VEDDISFSEATESLTIDMLSKEWSPLMETRCIEEYDLQIRVRVDPRDRACRRLRSRRDDRYFLTEECIEERRFPGIRSTDQGDISCFIHIDNYWWEDPTLCFASSMRRRSVSLAFTGFIWTSVCSPKITVGHSLHRFWHPHDSIVTSGG